MPLSYTPHFKAPPSPATIVCTPESISTPLQGAFGRANAEPTAVSRGVDGSSFLGKPRLCSRSDVAGCLTDGWRSLALVSCT